MADHGAMSHQKSTDDRGKIGDRKGMIDRSGGGVKETSSRGGSSQSSSRNQLNNSTPKPPPSAQQNTDKTPARKSMSGATARPCPEHTFLTDVADVRQMERGLLQLLGDFHSGQLQAFGKDCSFEKMDQVREQQERLARLHFELDMKHEMQHGLGVVEDGKVANTNLHKLMDNLQELCNSIHDLQKDHKNT